MANLEKINPNEKLRTSYPKINAAIEASGKADTNALQSLSKSEQAINKADQANTKADETQVQLNNIIIESGTSDAEVIQARGGAPVLNERLNGLDVQLAEIVNKDTYVESFPLIAPEVDDTARVQRAIDSATTKGKRLIFEPKKRYLVKNLTFYADDFEFMGNGATLASNLPVNTQGINGDINQFTILKDTINQIKSNLVPTSDITQGQTTLNLSDTVGIQVGDMVVITTTKPLSPHTSDKAGSFRFVKSLTSTQLTLDDGIENALSITNDSVKVNVYRPVNNIIVNDLNFELIPDGKQYGAVFRFVNGFTMNGGYFKGIGQNFMGLSVNGFNVRINGITCEEFLDDALNFGYGVCVSGHNIQVNKGTFYKCKHGIAGGAGQYLNTDIGYFDNYATDPQLCAFDAHGSCENVKMINNTVVNAGKSYAACGLWARGKNFELRGNTVRAAKNTSNTVSAFKILDRATLGISFTDNKAYDCHYGIKGDEVSGGVDVYSLEAISNRFYGIRSYAIKLKKIYDSIISDNFIESNGWGIYSEGVENSTLKGNTINFAIIDYGAGIYFEAMTDKVYKNVSVTDNKITIKSTNGTNPIRIRNGYDVLIIKGNINDVTAKTTQGKISTSENTAMTAYIVEGNL